MLRRLFGTISGLFRSVLGIFRPRTRRRTTTTTTPVRHY